MIGFLAGKIVSLGTESLLLDVHGVGYQVYTTSNLLSEATVDSELSLFIHTAVREDAITLYGFKKEEDLHFFKQLLSVSGIGPKLALGILSSSSELVKNAVLDGDEAMLNQIPGIGKKTAQRIIIELKNKVVPSTTKPRSIRKGCDDAIEALLNLGYDRGMVMKVMNDMPTDISGTEDIVKYFLKNA
jgi:Holliday junction DNA helicase RuvA